MNGQRVCFALSCIRKQNLPPFKLRKPLCPSGFIIFGLRRNVLSETESQRLMAKTALEPQIAKQTRSSSTRGRAASLAASRVASRGVCRCELPWEKNVLVNIKLSPMSFDSGERGLTKSTHCTYFRGLTLSPGERTECKVPGFNEWHAHSCRRQVLNWLSVLPLDRLIFAC